MLCPGTRGVITLQEQLKDPLFRKWMTKVPTLTVIGTRDPWWVYVQREVDGPWARAGFPRYGDAYRFLVSRLKTSADLALNCSRQEFKPPIVKVQGKRRYHLPGPWAPSGGQWCGHCRRLVEFKFFSRHHALRGINVDPSARRCVICGVRQNSIRRYP